MGALATRALDPLAGDVAWLQFLSYSAPTFLLGALAFGTLLQCPQGGSLGLPRGILLSLVMTGFLTLAYLLPAMLLFGYLKLVFG